MTSLSGKVALVTGASRPRGMGWAAALKLAEAGADVVVTGRVASSSEAPRDLGILSAVLPKALGAEQVHTSLLELVKLVEERGRRAIAVGLDVTDRAQVNAAVALAVEELGGLDILFNNAGVPYGAGPFTQMTFDQWQGSFDVNATGMFHTCQASVPAMIARGGGAIINNASQVGIVGAPYMAAYSASKFAVVGLTKSLALEFGPQGIRCNAICPGMIDTNMGDLEYQAVALEKGVSIDAARREIAGTIPLGRLGVAEDVADVVVFLAGPKSRYLTGLAVPVTGGL